MPESVESPAPVRTTSGRPARRARASARIPQLGPGASLLGLDRAVLRGSGGDEVVDEVARDVGDLGDGPVEDLLVGLRRLGRAADLADELERGRSHLVVGGRRLEVVERADVAAHASRLRADHDSDTRPATLTVELPR